MNGTKIFQSALILFFFCLQNSTSLYGQTNTVRGTVYNQETRLPIEGVICKYYNSEKVFLGYALSNHQGVFEAFFTSSLTSIHFSLIGYNEWETKDISTDMEIYLEPKTFEIEEIFIKAPLISRDQDTLHYNISHFKSFEDSHLIDVLKRLPGVEVNPSGAIKYEGKSINKFYIEGLDLMGQRYGVAVKSIPIEAIYTVQIIENNQHIKTLKGIDIPDEAAVNIKLNESYKHVPFGQLESALGFQPFLIQSKLFASQLGQKQQSLIRLQTDNTGSDIISDAEEFAGSFNFFFHYPKPQTFLANYKTTSIPMDKKRYINNETYTGTFNHLYKHAEYKTWRLNGNYLKDNQEQRIENQSRFHLLDQQQDFQLDENILNRGHRSKANFTAQYENNSPETYLYNEINASIDWNKSIKTVSSRRSSTAQTSQNSYQIQHKFSFILGNKDNKYTLNSFTRWISQPEIFKNEHKNNILNTTDHQIQNIRNNHFISKIKLHRNSTLLGHILSNGMELFFTNDNIKTDLQTAQQFNFLEHYLFTNHIKMLRWGATVTPEYRYHKSNWKSTLVLPLRFEAYIPEKQLTSDSGAKRTLFSIDPRFKTTYTLNPFFKLNFSASKTTHRGSVQNYLSSVIMTDYRNYYAATGILEKSIAQNYNFGVDYQNLISAFFFNLSLSYEPVKSNLTHHRFYDPDYQITTTLLRNITSSTTTFEIKADKYLSKQKTNIVANFNFRQYQSELIQQEVPFDNYSNSFMSKFMIHFRKIEWLSFNYSWTSHLFWEKNNFTNSNTLNNINQNLKTYFILSENLHLNLSAEHNYIELSEDLFVENYFLDLESKYKLSDITFFLNLQNLFNRKNYSFTQYSGVNNSTVTIPIRPRSLLFGVVFSF